MPVQTSPLSWYLYPRAPLGGYDIDTESIRMCVAEATGPIFRIPTENWQLVGIAGFSVVNSVTHS
jgi:hypothetical protein